MKFLIGIISGIALAGAGVTVASSHPFDAAAATVTPEVAYAQPSVAHTQTAAKRFSGSRVSSRARTRARSS